MCASHSKRFRSLLSSAHCSKALRLLSSVLLLLLLLLLLLPLPVVVLLLLLV
jgi:hypothetical protein